MAGLWERWQAAAALIADSRDVLAGRPGDGEAPAALAARGWVPVLAALSDDELAAHESHGLEAAWPAGTPSSLRALCAAARDVSAVAPVALPSGPARAARKLETPRKSQQIDAFVRLILPLATRATRVLDVGSGHGHLTRDLAERLALPVVGLERNQVLAGRARSIPSRAAPSFMVTDVLADGLAPAAGELVMGLHACGELGDRIVESAAVAGAAVALVGCCLQKCRAATRRPLCRAPGLTDALELPRPLLGLSNLSAREQGVEATRAENLAARERRIALHRLLSQAGAGAELRLGAELIGLNRRAAQLELPALAARAFAVRGWPPPTEAAIVEAAAWARDEHARRRRLSLPRALLARVLEVFVLLDRACFLEQRGYAVTVGTLFPAAVSARNLVLVGARA